MSKNGDLNEVKMTGRLEGVPSLKYNPRTGYCSTATLLCRMPAKDDFAPAEEDCFHIVGYGSTAEKMEKLAAGEYVQIAGRLYNHRFTDRYGNRRTIPEIILVSICRMRQAAEQVEMISQ